MRTLVIFLAMVATVAAQAKEPPGPEGFDKGIRSVQTFIDRAKWKSAQDALLGALEAHRERDYVRGRRVEIEGLMEKIVFHLKNEAPDPKKLISGELVAYNLSTGRLKVRYTPDTMDDWSRSPERIHPAAFAGPYSMEIKGRSYPAAGNGLILLAGLDEDEGYAVVFGRAQVNEGNLATWVPARLRYVKGSDSADLDSKETSPSRPGKPFTVRVEVDASRVCGAYNGRALLTGKKRKGLWGRVGIDLGGTGFDEIVIEGQAEPAWLQGLIDAQVQKQQAAFKEKWRPQEILPAWLYATPVTRPASVRAGHRAWPEDSAKADRRRLDEITAHYQGGRFDKGLRVIGMAGSEELPVATREFLLGQFHCALGDFDKALVHARKVAELDPQFARARALEAEVLHGLGRGNEAVKVWQSLVEEYPGEPGFHVAGARLLLDLGRCEEAKEAVERAVAQGLSSEELEAVNRLVVKAVQGPPFRQRFEVRTVNYSVVSDIDKKTCESAAAILEESYLAYRTYLEPVKDIERRKFVVYLFSGEDGYKAYCSDLWGGAPGMTAGLYSPSLKQLLIWNLASREDMMRTVRHEGFHQYLDRLMDEPPLWFNEGLAEYYETSVMVNGSWKLGEPRADHLAVLQKNLMPLRDFLYRSARDFQRDPIAHYAQSWAFIHFLRHSTPDRKKLFEAFWKAFRTTPSNRAAMDLVLLSIDLGSLERDFQAHVKGLF
jgi:tetratricopeptide (TPR) repeat protein